MDKRPINVVTLDESLINDGDFFGVCAAMYKLHIRHDHLAYISLYSLLFYFSKFDPNYTLINVYYYR